MFSVFAACFSTNVTFHSIINGDDKWTLVQLTLQDGAVYEADFGSIEDSKSQRTYPNILLDEDGIGMYVTGKYNPKGDYTAVSDTISEQYGGSYTYFPRNQFARLKVTTKK